MRAVKEEKLCADVLGLTCRPGPGIYALRTPGPSIYAFNELPHTSLVDCCSRRSDVQERTPCT